ncbi:hypothetical protein OLZ32_09285 [Rhizobium sp. 1AS11]|uniref:hypothetical protein n=1 Tax=Rhizobium acaciae TaxID=2989736 RepID=UPI0022220B09|nr:hypothetical protein [Rhizobium acaciae]MCW1408793.1 hypothetical protein [Rhizobium acaciae]MCW1740607.1 hypothetical protein [Rhizobium acaciae]
MLDITAHEGFLTGMEPQFKARSQYIAAASIVCSGVSRIRRQNWILILPSKPRQGMCSAAQLAILPEFGAVTIQRSSLMQGCMR